MPTQNEHGIYISDSEKAEAIRKGEHDLKAWRQRNPDAPTGRPAADQDEAEVRP